MNAVTEECKCQHCNEVRSKRMAVEADWKRQVEDFRDRLLKDTQTVNKLLELCHRLGKVRKSLCGRVSDMDLRKSLFRDQYEIIDEISRILGYLPGGDNKGESHDQHNISDSACDNNGRCTDAAAANDLSAG